MARNKYREIEMRFNMSAKGIGILFIVSVAGILVGLSGWLLNPPFFWNFPENYYILITFGASKIFALTLIFKILTNNLRLSLNQLKPDKKQ